MPLTKKQKARELKLAVFPLAKGFMNNLMTILEEGERKWNLLPESFTLKATKLTLKFELTENARTQKVNELDHAQKRIDDTIIYEEQEEEEEILTGIPDEE